MLGTDEEMQIDLEARLVRFEKLLDKFDRVKSDGQFQIVTQPREFGLAHDALRHFVEHLQQLVAEVRNAEQQNPEGELVIPASASLSDQPATSEVSEGFGRCFRSWRLLDLSPSRAIPSA